MEDMNEGKGEGKTCGGGAQPTDTGQPLDYDGPQWAPSPTGCGPMVTSGHQPWQPEGGGKSRGRGGWSHDGRHSQWTRGGGGWRANWRDDANESWWTR